MALEAKKSELARCFGQEPNKALELNEAHVNVVVEDTGIAREASVEDAPLRDSALGRCLEGVVRSMEFGAFGAPEHQGAGR